MVLRFATVSTTALLLGSFCFAAQPEEQSLTLTMGGVRRCPDHLAPPMRMFNISMRVDPKTGDMYIDGDIVMDESLQDPAAMIFEFYKCLTRDEESCKLDRVLETKTVCDQIDKKGMVWSYLLERIEGLKLKCPVPAGRYRLVDGPITKSLRDTGKLIKGHWRLKAMLKKKGRVVGCMRGHGEVKAKRRQKG